MSAPSGPSPAAAAAARDALAAAAAARVATHATPDSEAQYAAERNERQEFRRLVTVGIQRNNDARTAEQTINTLLKLADNILNNPNEDKYKQFKTTNSTVKRTLIDPKGSLEYAQALGFRADVVNFQPFYLFTPTPKKLTSLRIGASVLREVVERNTVNSERTRHARDTEKAAAARQTELVRLAYEDDRKEKLRRDTIEKERREALAKLAREAPLGDTAPFDEQGRVYGGPLPRRDKDGEDEEGEDEDDIDRIPGRFGGGGHSGFSILPLKGSAFTPVSGVDDTADSGAEEEGEDDDMGSTPGHGASGKP